MKLHVAEANTIADIQGKFNAAYPYLKIEFFNDPYANNNVLEVGRNIKGYEQVRKFQSTSHAGSVNIRPARLIREVENDLHKLIGLYAEIYRKSGKVWIATSLTKDWTLKQQNEEGKLISNSCADE